MTELHIQMKEQTLNQALTSMQKHTKSLFDQERISARERQFLEEASQLLGLDGLLAHSSVEELINYYCLFYDGTGCVPEHCQVQLHLLEQSAKDQQVQAHCQDYEALNHKLQNVLSRLQIQEREVIKTLSVMKEKSSKEKQRLDKFELDSSAYVRSQNQKLESQVNQTSGSCQAASEELVQQYESITQQIRALSVTYCGQYPFPESKSDAIELLNVLDSRLQSAQIQILSKK